ncbi:hypothetical protein Q3G72_025469 [Acer saccharum]|nr:hypothetical protein Q3G72_025469 [Acer saccharum]
MLKAMALGHAYIGEDSWSCFRVGSLSDCLHNLFNSASYAEQKAEEVKSSYERKIKDLEHQALTVESLSKEAGAGAGAGAGDTGCGSLQKVSGL